MYLVNIIPFDVNIRNIWWCVGSPYQAYTHIHQQPPAFVDEATPDRPHNGSIAHSTLIWDGLDTYHRCSLQFHHYLMRNTSYSTYSKINYCDNTFFNVIFSLLRIRHVLNQYHKYFNIFYKKKYIYIYKLIYKSIKK